MGALLKPEETDEIIVTSQLLSPTLSPMVIFLCNVKQYLLAS